MDMKMILFQVIVLSFLLLDFVVVARKDIQTLGELKFQYLSDKTFFYDYCTEH